MARLRYNGLATTLAADLTAADTTITFAAPLVHSGGTAVPTIGGGDYIPLAVLNSTGALAELVNLTAYTAGATTGTIARGQEGTTATAHTTGDQAINSATVADFTAASATNLTQVRKSADQTLASYAYTAISFDTEDYDTLGLHDNATNNTRLTIPTGQSGLYEFTAMVVISGGVGPYYLQFHKNGSAYPGRAYAPAAGNGYTDFSLTRQMVLVAGDYVEIKADNESGANRSIMASAFSGEAQTVLSARRIGPTPA